MPLTRAFGQGSCAGRDRDTTAACNKAPFKAPFEPTGFKTVLLDHFKLQVVDAEREAAFYAAFLGWKVRSNDGNEIYMDIGDWGGVKIRGGYVAPARGAGRRRRAVALVEGLDAARRRQRGWRTRAAAAVVVVAARTRAGCPNAPQRARWVCLTAVRSGTASAGASRPGTRTRSKPRSRRVASIPSPITAATTSAASM